MIADETSDRGGILRVLQCDLVLFTLVVNRGNQLVRGSLCIAQTSCDGCLLGGVVLDEGLVKLSFVASDISQRGPVDRDHMTVTQLLSYLDCFESKLCRTSGVARFAIAAREVVAQDC